MRGLFLVVFIIAISNVFAQNAKFEFFNGNKTKIKNPFGLRDPFKRKRLSLKTKKGKYSAFLKGNFFSNLPSIENVALNDIRIVGVLLGKKRRAMAKIKNGKDKSAELIAKQKYILSSTENGFGRQWDDWSFTWSGSSVNDDNLIKVRKTSATTNTISRFANVSAKNKTRTGIVSTKPPETIKRSIGNRAVSVSIVPYIRSQKVQFVAKGVKPNATFYPFFDNQAVSANTKPAYAVTYTANTSSANSGVFNTRAGEQITLTQTNSNGIGENVDATAMALYQNSSTVLISDITQVVTMSSTFATNPTVGENITFYSDSGKSTQTATATIQEYDVSNKLLTINSISGTIATGNYANGASTGDYGVTTVSHTGGITTGELFSGEGTAKANGNITAAPSTTPTFSGALTADKNGIFELNNLELAKMIAHSMKKKLKFKMVDFHSSRPGHDLRYALDGQLIKDMGWSPKISIDERINQVVNWSLENKRWLKT